MEFKEKDSVIFDKWDKMVNKNIDGWMDEFFALIKDRSSWDTTFMDFVELKMFKLEFKDVIDRAIDDYEEKTGKDVDDYDSFALALLDVKKESTDWSENEGGIA